MSNYTVRYDEPLKVTKRQYEATMSVFSGIVAGREDIENGQEMFYVKCWNMRYKTKLNKFLQSKE